jgi:predicted ATPase
VAAALGKGTEEIETICEEIARKKRFLQEAEVVTWPDGTLSGRYTFRHRLYKDVLYHHIAEARRVRWHRQIAERIETGYGDQSEDIAGELALHCERGRQYLNAAHYLQLAARKALRRRGAPTVAIAIAQKGLELLENVAETTTRTAEEIEL